MEGKTKQQELVGAFMRVDRLHRSVVEQQVRKLGIHRSQHMLLMYLSRCEKPPTQACLAREFDISPAAVTVSLQKLEKAGLVERSLGGDDRTKNIRITDDGMAIVRKTEKLFRNIDKAMCESFSEEQLTRLLSELNTMQENLKKMNE